MGVVQNIKRLNISKSGHLKIAVLMGGHPLEHQSTLALGSIIIKHLLLENKYEIFPVKITEDKKWQLPSDPLKKYEEFVLSKVEENSILAEVYDALRWFKKEKIDVVFIASLGDYGEDGTLQGLFEMADIAYIGSGVKASAFQIDKAMSSRLFAAAGLLVPDFMDFKSEEWKEDRDKISGYFQEKLDFPIIVKPVDRGVSMGVSVPKNLLELEDSIEKAFGFSDRAMIQRLIKGVEITCYIFDQGPRGAVALAPLVIDPGGDFLNLESKFSFSQKIKPADASVIDIESVKNTALLAHKTLGCAGLSRTDMIVSEDKKIYLLEINTLPMLSPGPIVMALGLRNISFCEFLGLMIEEAIERKKYD